MSSDKEPDLARLQRLLEETQQQLQKEQQNYRQEEQKTRPTTFEEYIRLCHIHLSMPLCIQTNKSLTTKGSITSSKNKACPTLLKPWSDFSNLLEQLCQKILNNIPSEERLFSSSQYLTELGQSLCDRPFASEDDLRSYQRFAVEQPTAIIVRYLCKNPTARLAFNLGDGFSFENHANTLGDTNEEVRQGLEDLQLSSKHKKSRSNPKPKDADQICVYVDMDGAQKLCMIVEYKAAHKLTALNLRTGLLKADGRSLDLPQDVFNRITIPTDREGQLVYYSEKLVATAFTQVYEYMIKNGLQYSVLTTGEAYVYLWIRKDEPHTLYYHLAEPNFEAKEDNEIDLLLPHTAVGQMLAISLLALGSDVYDQAWRDETLKNAQTTTVDYETVLRQIPEKVKASSPPSSEFSPSPLRQIDRKSPYMLRSRNPQKTRESCGSSSLPNTHHISSSSSDESSYFNTPSKPPVSLRPPELHQTQNTSKTAPPDNKGGSQSRAYCTQACLLGLVKGSRLDEACPNVSLHRRITTTTSHAFKQDDLACCMQQQLQENLDHWCEPLGKQGARGALFKLTLVSHGYTFVGKGTVKAFVPDLKHEGKVYRQLARCQGKLIPVYLGNINLAKRYFLAPGVEIIHMLLMSWGGEQARKDLMLGCGQHLEIEKSRANEELVRYGINHGDLRAPNMLWSSENSRLMLIDFERSMILEQRHLQELSPNRKRRQALSANESDKFTRHLAIESNH